MKVKREVNFRGVLKEIEYSVSEAKRNNFKNLDVSNGRHSMVKAFYSLPKEAQTHIAKLYAEKCSKQNHGDTWRIKKILESGNFDSVKDVLEQVSIVLGIEINIKINAIS